MELKDFKTDKGKEENGVWEDLGDGCSVLVARYGNPAMVSAYRRYPRVLRQRLESGQVDDDKSANIMAKVMADTILLDWKGLKEDGKEVLYSKEECVRVLIDYPDVRSMIFDISNETQLYHDESVGKTIKNLKSG